VYKKEYLNLVSKYQTAPKKEHIMKELSRSVVATARADIPFDCITQTTMHVILKLKKKIVDWILSSSSRLEALKEEETTGHTTCHF
jgi:hypothetical protein